MEVTHIFLLIAGQRELNIFLFITGRRDISIGTTHVFLLTSRLMRWSDGASTYCLVLPPFVLF
jgi:hypothetical protein